MLRTRLSCLDSTDTTVVYTPQMDDRHDRRVHDGRVYGPHIYTTVVPRYYGHNRRVCSTDARRLQDGNTHQPNYYH